MSVTIDTGEIAITRDTVLAALEEAQVFKIVRQDDGRFEIVERCDEWYGAFLTREQMLMLADEIRALAG